MSTYSSLERFIYNLYNSTDETLTLLSICWSFQHNVEAFCVFIWVTEERSFKKHQIKKETV